MMVGPGGVEGTFPSHSALLRPAEIVPLVKALAFEPVDDFTGALHVAGHPGGVFYLDHGTITAVDSPGAPDVSTLLLRSGRVTAGEWSDVMQAGAADGRIGAELVTRRLVGPAELQVMCQAAALDAAFAITIGRIEHCTLVPGAPRHWLPAQQGMERESLLREIERRLNACARGSISIAPYQDRLSLGPYALDRLDDLPDDELRQILRRVNGRRSTRDIAFMLGRSVYAVAVQVSRMVSEGLIEVTTRPSVSDLEDTRPVVLRPRSAAVITGSAVAPDSPDSPESTTSQLDQPDQPGPAGLPRRRRGASGISKVVRPRPTPAVLGTGHSRDPSAGQNAGEVRKDTGG